MKNLTRVVEDESTAQALVSAYRERVPPELDAKISMEQRQSIALAILGERPI